MLIHPTWAKPAQTGPNNRVSVFSMGEHGGMPALMTLMSSEGIGNVKANTS